MISAKPFRHFLPLAPGFALLLLPAADFNIIGDILVYLVWVIHAPENEFRLTHINGDVSIIEQQLDYAFPGMLDTQDRVQRGGFLLLSAERSALDIQNLIGGELVNIVAPVEVIIT